MNILTVPVAIFVHLVQLLLKSIHAPMVLTTTLLEPRAWILVYHVLQGCIVKVKETLTPLTYVMQAGIALEVLQSADPRGLVIPQQEVALIRTTLVIYAQLVASVHKDLVNLFSVQLVNIVPTLAYPVQQVCVQPVTTVNRDLV